MQGYTGLHIACYHPCAVSGRPKKAAQAAAQLALIPVLLAAGADVNTMNVSGKIFYVVTKFSYTLQSPMYEFAVFFPVFFPFLLVQGQTPVSITTPEIAQLLLDAGADITRKDVRSIVLCS